MTGTALARQLVYALPGVRAYEIKKFGRGIAIAVTGILAGSCSAADDAAAPAGSGTGASSHAGGAGGAGGAGSGGTPLAGSGGGLAAGGGEPRCATGCSADQKKIVDCHGDLISECPSDRACANGECIDEPCKAAELSKSSVGCEYWALEGDVIEDAGGACFAAFVANTWTVPIHIEAEYQGESLPVEMFTRVPIGQGDTLTYAPYDASAGLAVGEVAILFLSREPDGAYLDCPAPAAIDADASTHQTSRGHAFRITTDGPAVAYQIYPYGGAASAVTSGTLLLPTSAWDTNYIAVNAYEKSLDPLAGVPRDRRCARMGSHRSMQVISHVIARAFGGRVDPRSPILALLWI